MPVPAASLLDWIATDLPAAQATLRPPAFEEALAEVGEVLGHPLPAGLAALYRAHDGQDQAPMRASVFEGFRWLPLAECLAERAVYAEVAAEVRRDYPEAAPWAASWLPFAGDGLGNAWVVDLASGRVFEFDHAEGEVAELGDSFEAFLDGYLASFAAGERVIDQALGVVRPPGPSTPPAPAPPVSPRRRAVGLVLLAVYVIALAAFVITLELRR
jgi:cell wall assembly regulator SMI1